MENILDDSYFCNLFQLESEIGAGAFGKVYKCRNRSSGEEIAVKVISKSGISKTGARQIISEANILGELSHPNVVKLKNLYESSFHFMLEMELLRGGTLESRILKMRYSDEECSKIMKEILSAISYLHDQDIIHRDIKPENIMFSDDSIEGVKLTDFGLSSQCTLEKGTDDNCGTVIFMAPEQAVRRVYNKPIDIWSCGIVMFMLISGRHPLSSARDTVESYFNKLKNVQWQFPEKFEPMAQDLFKRLTRIDPLERYTAQQALRHPWITRQASQSPPMTYLEKLNYFNNALKMRRIFSAALLLGTVRSKAETKENHSEGEMPKIKLGFAQSIRVPRRKHVSMIINNHRSPSPILKQTVRLNSLRRKQPKLL